MRRRLERDEIRPLTKLADKLGVVWERNHKGAGASSGWPDLKLYIDGGRVWLVEMKQKGKKPTALQMLRIETLRGLGYDVDWFSDADTACEGLTRRVGAQ